MNVEVEPKVGIADQDDGNNSRGPWKYTRSGTMEHTSGLRVSPDQGISFEGENFKITVNEIDFEDKDLGTGMCGTVKRGRIKKNDRPVAIKTMRVTDGGDGDMLLNEVKALKIATGCPYLVQWVAGFVSRKTGAVMLVLELMDGGSLRSVMERLGENHGVQSSEHASIAWQAMNGLAFLHDKKVIHRDIKPANMLLNLTGEVKLTDFGISCQLDGSGRASNRAATRIYMAPERYMEASCSLPSDIWSMGLVCYELATGRHPFSNRLTDFELMNLLSDEEEPRLPEADDHDASLRDLVARCLTRDVARRAKVGELLKHEFLASVAESPEEFKKALCALLDSMQSQGLSRFSSRSSVSSSLGTKSALASSRSRGQRSSRRVSIVDAVETIEVSDLSKDVSFTPSFTIDEWINVESVTILSEELEKAKREARDEHQGSSHARPNIEKGLSRGSNRSSDGRCLCIRGILTKLNLC